MFKKFYLLAFILIITTLSCFAQGIKEWATHTPGRTVISVDVMHEKIFAATPYDVFYYNTDDNSINRLTKVNGLSDFGVKTMRYCSAADCILIGYSNANIDLVDNNGNITNITDIKDKNILGNKTINNVYFFGSNAYLSCGFGIVVVNLTRKEIKDTYIIGEGGTYMNINDIALYNGNLYAATEEGVFYASIENTNLADYSQWTRDETMFYPYLNYNQIETFNNKLIANYTTDTYNSDTLFIFDGNRWDYYDNTLTSTHREIRAYNDRLAIANDYTVQVYNTGNERISNFDWTYPYSVAYDAARNVYWIGDQYRGMIKTDPNYVNVEDIKVTGPYANNVFEIKAKGDYVWVVPGGYSSTWAPVYSESQNCIFHYDNNTWTFNNGKNTPGMDSLLYFSCLAINPQNPTNVYAGSYNKGIYEFNNYKLSKVYNTANSTLGTLIGTQSVFITGLDFDSNNNLWVANCRAEKLLAVKTTGGTWYSYNIGNGGGDISHILVDKNNYKWVLTREGTIIVFNDNNTLTNTADDKYKVIRNTTGQGGLPGVANCMALDNNGTVWVGTTDGIGLFTSTEKIFQSGANYDATKILVPRNDGSGQADYLLSGESVRAIAVDGANKLWLGTNNGVFYVSNDGLTQYENFTEENSPLLSNAVENIAIDGNGNVYFGTSKGIISYRNTATNGNDTNSNVVVYPNPVKNGYSGYVGIKGLVTDALVKITTVDGSFVTHLQGEGGQAVWDCTTIDGKKVAPGIYLIFVSDETGKETYATKVLIMN